jgi:putative MATE family efflux protein
MAESFELMGTAPIPRLILHFALPATVGVLANALYNIVDRIFIGHYAGASGLAAISVVFPVVLASVAFSGMVGVGASSQISRALGAQNLEKAQRAFGNGILAWALINLLTVAPLLIWLPEAVRLCGAPEGAFDLTCTYLQITGPFIPAAFLTMVLMSCMRAEGHPRYAMWGMVLGSLVNVVLDWWFIAGLNMGVAGAAWGTAAAQSFGLVWVGAFYLSGRGAMKLSVRSMRPDAAVLAEIFMVGFSPFLINIFFAVMMMCFNILLGKYGGEMAVSAMGIFFGLDSLLFMPVTGIGEGAMPVMGFNYGARKWVRLRKTVKIALTVSVVYYALSEAAAMIWPEKLAALFTTNNPELIRLTARCMRIGYAALPFGAVAVIVGYMLEALGRARVSFLFNFARLVFAFLLLAVLPRFLGVDGVWLSFPAVDFMGGLTCIFLLKNEAEKWH